MREAVGQNGADPAATAANNSIENPADRGPQCGQLLGAISAPSTMQYWCAEPAAVRPDRSWRGIGQLLIIGDYGEYRGIGGAGGGVDNEHHPPLSG
jgi:hypothetical protein